MSILNTCRNISPPLFMFMNTFHDQMFVPAQCWVAPVTRWLPDHHNLSLLLLPATRGGTLIFFPQNLQKKEGSEFQLFVLERGSQNLECTGRKLQKQGYLYWAPSFSSLLLSFPLLLFPIKGRRDDGAMKKLSPGVGVCARKCTCALICCGRVKRFRGGGLPSRAVSHHTVDPPGSFRCPSGFIILLSS